MKKQLVLIDPMAFNNKCIVGILVILCLALASKARVLNPRNYSKTRGFVRIKGSIMYCLHTLFHNEITL